MSTIVLFIILISFMDVTEFSWGFEDDFELDNFKVTDESGFLEPKNWTDYSKLLAVQVSDSFCKRSRDIIFPHFHLRNLYYRCQNGRKELYQCVEGFEFSNNRLRCTAQNNTLTQIFDDCAQQMDGLYPNYKSNCKEYFKCKNGIKVELLQCPAGQSFSFHLQNCQPSDYVTCAEPNCDANNDGFYLNPSSKCQAYYYCHRGIRSDFLCPKGYIFNRQSKLCVENGICYEPVCVGRIDGHYADTTHDCTRSFYCKGGVLERVDSCPPDQKHDGNACTLEFTGCDKPEKTAAAFYFRANDECKFLQDGVHIVQGTDCRNVRICLRGKTSAAFECARNQRFNGHRCFPKTMVPCDDACSMKSDGYYADEFTDCQSYYSCLNGNIVRRKQCPNNTAFNGYSCAPSYLVPCPKKYKSPMDRCIGLRDGFHPDYLNGCRNYFYCYNHEMVLTGSCPEGMIWNERQCVENQYSTCIGPSELHECDSLSPGLYQNKTSGCVKYFYCNRGSGTILSCPVGKLFDGNKCINEDEYTCLSANECINQPDGYKQDKNTGCRSYYFCSNGNKLTYVCPDNLLFNGSHCVSPDLYQCPFNASLDCYGKSNGYHPDISADCKKYYYCSENEKLNTLSCEGKKIFDGQGCRLVEDPKSVCHAIGINLCAGKHDGTYANHYTNCRKYFTCKNQSLSYEYWCPQGYGFNGRTCVKDFNCLSKRKTNICNSNYIGFFQDLESNCRNYFLCVGGIQTTVSCPLGTIFNGHLCIDSNYYKCPSRKS